MATSIDQIREFLDEFDLRYQVDEESPAILIGFSLDPQHTTYRDRDGDARVGLVIRLVEDGEFMAVFAPWAWNVHGCPHRAAVFEALAAIQTQYKMLRFDHDPSDGEIRPNVELPLEDSELTSRQFHRAVHAVMHGIQRFDGVIRHAMETGEVSFASVEDDESGITPDTLQLRRLAAEAGGIEALEQIACGGGAESTDEEPAGDKPGRGQESTPDRGAESSASPPQPVIRWIWERLFGPAGPERGSERRAG